MTRAERRHRSKAIALKRRSLYREIWGEFSREYVESVPLNMHAQISLGRLCSCEMCQPRTASRRAKQKREWKRQELPA